MPEMATVCQETSGTPPNMFGPRNAQGVGPPHGYYNHCGYPTSSGHPQYSNDGYVSFQTSQTEHPSHLQHHMHGRQQQHHQQTWDYSMGVGVMGTSRHGVLADDWTQCYLLPGSSAPAQNSYNYQYRGTPSHGALDYAPSLQAGHEADVHVLEGSPSPNSSSPGEATNNQGPNNQGAKSLRPPYEWMKPTAALPQAGKTRTKDKYRVVYSDHQRLELEKEFHFSKYITIRRKAEIASQLGLSERQDIGVNISIFQLIVDFLATLRSVVCHCFLSGRLTYPVKIWFQNRRAKERKQNKKREEQVSIHQHGGSANNSGDLQQHIQHPSNHEPLPHPFIPKIELEDDKSTMHELACHNTNHAQVAGLTSHASTPTTIVLPQSPFLHHSPNMVMSPIIMSRGHAHPSVGRYHDNVQTTISPNTGHDEVVYRMTVNSDNSGNNMNLSGSSDSGVVSAH